MVASARSTRVAFLRYALSLALALAAALTGGSRAEAEENSSALVLRGYVPIRCEIAVEPTADAGRLDLAQGHRDLLVARVTERCNSGSGYTVRMSSQGRGELVGPSASVGYRLRYQGSSPEFSRGKSSPALVANRSERTGAEGVERELRISVPAATEIAGGWYEDTVTLTIAAK